MADTQPEDTSQQQQPLEEILKSIKDLNHKYEALSESVKRPHAHASGHGPNIKEGGEGDNPNNKRVKTHDDGLSSLFEPENDEGNRSSEESDFSDDEDYLNNLASLLDDPDKSGPKVSEKLAAVANKVFDSPLSTENMKDKIKKYDKPENCKKMLVPRVNPEMWKRLSKPQKSVDTKLSLMQNGIMKASIAIIQALDTIGPNLTTVKRNEMRANLGDAVAMLGKVSHDMAIRRRGAMKSALPRKYADVFGNNIPVTKWLFGDEIIKSMKDAKKFDDALPKNDYRQQNWNSKNWTGRRGQNYNRKPHWEKRKPKYDHQNPRKPSHQ